MHKLKKMDQEKEESVAAFWMRMEYLDRFEDVVVYTMKTFCTSIC